MSEIDERLARLERAVFSGSKPAPPPATGIDYACRAPFLGWRDMVEIERALMLAPPSEATAGALLHVREELDRGERLGVFSDKDRGRPHPKPLRRYVSTDT